MKAARCRAADWARLAILFIQAAGSHPFPLAIRRGLVLILPLVLSGAMAVFLRDFPFPGLHHLLDNLLGPGWRTFVVKMEEGSFCIASMAIACTTAISFASQHNARRPERRTSLAMTAAVVLSCYFVLAAPSKDTPWKDLLALDTGLLTSLLVAATASPLFLRLSGCRPLRMPLSAVGHDPVVYEALSSAPAGVAVILLFGLVRALLDWLGLVDIQAAAQHLFGLPFRDAAPDLGAGLAYVTLSQTLWFFGAHGPSILNPVEQTLLNPAALANIQAAAAGQDLPFILTRSFLDVFVHMGGSGSTLCLMMAILLRSHDTGSRKLVLLTLLPALFNVNEPLLFGLPLIMNPVFAIPFLLVPVAQTILAYAATALDLVPRTGFPVGWTIPPLLGGLAATGSVAGTLMQVVNLLLGMLLYLPFVSLADQVYRHHHGTILSLLTQAATSGAPGPDGRKCLNLPGEAGVVAKALANDLAHALERGQQLHLVFQPQIDTNGHQVTGVEALLRWLHPVYGYVPPPVAVALAEDTDIIDRLGMLVLTMACEQHAAWRHQGAESLTLAVNMSVRQLEDPGLVGKVAAILHRTGLAPEALEVEITESVALQPDSRTMSTLRGLRNLGIKVAIDDFGMGHTSLRYLREFPVDKVKIDRSLTQESPDNINEQIVRSIVSLCGALGIRSVVEGVETKDQLDRFLTLGCTLFQGYLFSRPLAGDACLSFILAHCPLDGCPLPDATDLVLP